MGRELELDKFFEVGERGAEIIPVVHARLDERGQFLQLLPTNRGLRVKWLQVVAEVRINVFVIVAFRQFAKLPAETLVAGVVLAAGAPAVAAPVAETLDKHFQFHVAHDVHRAAFAHREVMRRIKTLRGQIAERAGESAVVTAAERIAVVLDQPEIMALAKFRDGGEVEGIAERVRHHHGLGFARCERGFELAGPSVQRGGIIINEHRHTAVL